MSTALAVSNTQLTMWEDAQRLDEIRKLFAPKLSDNEFKHFIGMGKSTGLNPFLREIWSVKYQENVPAQVFIGRDGYRKAAQAHSNYDYHQCDTVYENDIFEIDDGKIRHRYTLKDRGQLFGAYCIVKRRNAEKAVYVFTELKEYSTNQSLWKTKPATMIKKVAESQALRMAFQDLLGGTYGEEELAARESAKLHVITGNTQTDKLNNLLDQQIVEGDITEYCDNTGRDDLIITEEQISTIYTIMQAKEFTEDRINKAIGYALKHYKVSHLNELTDAQAREFIAQLEEA